MANTRYQGAGACAKTNGIGANPEYEKYRYSNKEAFAEAHADHLTGRVSDPRFARLFRKAAVPKFAFGGKVKALLTPGEFVFGKDAAARLGPNALRGMNEHGEMPRFAMGGPVLRYAEGTGATDLHAIITKIVSGIRANADAKQDTALRLLQSSQSYDGPPSQLETFLREEAQKEVRNSYRREERHRAKFVTGATNKAGNPVVDTALAREAVSNEHPYDIQVRKLAAQYGAEGKYASTIGKGRKEELVRLAMERGDLTGDEAAAILGRPLSLPKPAPPVVSAAAYSTAPTSSRATPTTVPPTIIPTTPPVGSGGPLLKALPPGPPPLKALPPHVAPDVYGFAPIPLGTSLPNSPANRILGGGKGVIGDAIPLADGPSLKLGGAYGFARESAASAPVPLSGPTIYSSGVYGSTPIRNAKEEASAAAAAQKGRERAEAEQALRLQGFRNQRVGVGNVADTTADRFRTSVAQAGGPALLSQQTLAEKATEAHAKVEQELTRGIERQLKALYPAITATEARRKAEEMAQKALTEDAVVLRNKKGQAVGTAALGGELAVAGKSATGQGAFGRFFSERSGAVGRALTGVAQRVGGAGNLGTLSFLTAAPKAAERIGPSENEYKTAAVTGNTTGVRNRAAASGALSGAAMGAGIGMMFGLWGLAIGAATGAVAGFAQGLMEAEKEIREAKVGDALGKLASSLQSVTGNVHDTSSISSSQLNEQLGTIRREVEAKSTDSLKRSWYNPVGWFDASIDQKELSAVRTKETRSAFGGQAGAMVGVLSRQAEKLARDYPEANTTELGKKLGADPVADALMRVVTDVRGVPIGQVLKEFTQTIETTQRQIRTQAEIDKGRRAAEQSADALSRLADAVTNAAASSQKFETSMLALSGAFSGQGGAIRVGNGLSNGFAQFGSGTGAEFKRSADVLSAALGPAGSTFIKRSNAADQVSRELPSVLNSLGKSDGAFSTDKARTLLQDRLMPGMDKEQQEQALKNNPELKAAIESALGSLAKEANSNKDGGINKRLREDPGKLAEEITASFTGPLKEAGEKMAKAIEENAQKFVDGLAQARSMLIAAAESQDKVGELRLAGQRIGADIQSDRMGRNATDPLSLHDLNAPFQDRQERLTGFQGEAANDPAAIAARLRDVTSRVTGAAAARDAVVGNKDEFAKRAGDLDKLTGEANHLQTALRTLANASERAAGIQEKLNAATANRDSRLGYAEKFISSSPEQQMRMRRGQDILSQVDQGKTGFNALSDDERRLALETANDLGQTRLWSGRTAAGLKQQMLGSVPGALDKGQEAERQGLQDQLAEVFKTGAEAQQELVNFQKGTYEKFL
ncbi:MAG: hypothetical protein JWO38_1459, partial [Gemmataceae bacterium]|nr:hypothetical protein [Gemmataceae bacterium]